jgi:AraC family transcriptional regulator
MAIIRITFVKHSTPKPMKPDTIFYHHETINKIMAYIEANIFKKNELSIAALAEIANICPKHTARIFKGGTGQSLGNYIHRAKMETAKELLLSGVSVTETSQKLEYENLSAFTNEYRKFFGYPPSVEKNQSMDHYKQLKIKNMNLKERIINLNTISVIFVQSIGSYNSNAPERAWNTLWDFVEKKNLNVDKSGFFGVVHDDTEVTKATQCRYDACISSISTEIPNNIPVGKKELPGGKYAVFTHKGAYKTLGSTYDQIFGPWLAATKEHLDDRPVLEKYLNDPFDNKAEDLITEIYVPIV